MTSPDAALAARPEACSACGGGLDTLGRCTKCGAVFGEAYRCPLCQALSDVEPNASLYFSCRACGGPRIPPDGTPISEPEVTLLRNARSEQLRAGAFKAGAGFAAASGVLSLLVTTVVLLATAPALFAKVAAFIGCLVPFALAFFALSRSRAHEKQLDAALHGAWLLAASRTVSQGGPITSALLAKKLRIDEARAEFLLAEVSVQDLIAAAPAELPARVRVTELAAPDELGLEAEQRAPAGTRKP
ncbi:MAG: hypothetical protein ABJB12_04925 [Pseudomonadota bacterium]